MAGNGGRIIHLLGKDLLLVCGVSKECILCSRLDIFLDDQVLVSASDIDGSKTGQPGQSETKYLGGQV